MIGPGVVINPDVLNKEIQDFEVTGRSFIDKHCGVIEETHLTRDSKGELKEKNWKYWFWHRSCKCRSCYENFKTGKRF